MSKRLKSKIFWISTNRHKRNHDKTSFAAFHQMMRPAVVVHVIIAFLSLLVAKGLSMPPKGKGRKKPLSPSPSAAEDKKLTEWITQASRGAGHKPFSQAKVKERAEKIGQHTMAVMTKESNTEQKKKRNTKGGSTCRSRRELTIPEAVNCSL